MTRRRLDTGLAGLSKPLNTLAVWLQLVSLACLVLAYQPLFSSWKVTFLLIGIPLFVLSASTLIVFRGGGLYTMYFRFLLGFGVIMLGCLHSLHFQDFKTMLGFFLSENHLPKHLIQRVGFDAGVGSLHGSISWLAYVMVSVEFVVGIMLLIGGSIRWFSILLLPIVLLYGSAFLFGAEWMDKEGKALWLFIDRHQWLPNLPVSLVASLLAVALFWIIWAIIFGYRIYPNSVRTNWYLLPVMIVLLAAFGWLTGNFWCLMIIPLSILFALYLYRIGGNFFGSHWFVAIIISTIPMLIAAFQPKKAFNKAPISHSIEKKKNPIQ